MPTGNAFTLNVCDKDGQMTYSQPVYRYTFIVLLIHHILMRATFELVASMSILRGIRTALNDAGSMKNAFTLVRSVYFYNRGGERDSDREMRLFYIDLNKFYP